MSFLPGDELMLSFLPISKLHQITSENSAILEKNEQKKREYEHLRTVSMKLALSKWGYNAKIGSVHLTKLWENNFLKQNLTNQQDLLLTGKCEKTD
jgi:hypothetical protein